MAFDKFRIRFRKEGDLRLVSHHDVMRCYERILRRAALPFRMTEGFHPFPRMVFALSLPLGMVGLNEVVELELTESMTPEEVLERLQTKAPPGIVFLSAKRIELKITARPRQALYHMPIPVGHIATLGESCSKLMQLDEIWVDRIRPTPKRLNIRPYLHRASCEEDRLAMEVWLSQEGSAKADEIVHALGLDSLLEAGIYLTRTDLILLDEMTPEQIAQIPPLPTKETRSMFERPLDVVPQPLEPQTPPTLSEWGASPSGPIVE
jgi:radical SAM-linked protein